MNKLISENFKSSFTKQFITFHSNKVECEKQIWPSVRFEPTTSCIRGHRSRKPPPLFDLKIVYSYVIEVADSESEVGLFSTALVSKIYAFYHLLDNAL